MKRWMVAASAALASQVAVADGRDDAAGQGAGSLDAERWRPGLDRSAILDVESGSLGSTQTAWGAWLGYARAPITSRVTLAGKTSDEAIVSRRLGLSLGGSWRQSERLRIGAELPVVLLQQGPATVPGVGVENPVALMGLGDLRLVPKWSLGTVAGGWPVDVALVGHLTVPTSLPRQQYIGDGLPTVAAEAAVSRSTGALHWAANVGPKLRVPSRFGPVAQGQELGYRVAAAYELGTVRGLPAALEASLSGAVLMHPDAAQKGSSPSELIVGAHADRGAWRYFAVLGAGLPSSDAVPFVGGIGAPTWRALVGARFEPVCDDADADGICLPSDACPEAAETRNAFEDADGCPDTAPVVDTDKDGLADAADRCPEAAGPAENGGCPDIDSDGDGVVDRLDRCVAEKGTVEREGCPVSAPVETIALSGTVGFEVSKAVLLDAALPVLDEAAATIKANPGLKVLVEGHTDTSGNARENVRLSEARAKAVLQYLVSKGVEASLLRSKGFGSAVPAAGNETAAGREKNRRVVLRVEP